MNNTTTSCFTYECKTVEEFLLLLKATGKEHQNGEPVLAVIKLPPTNDKGEKEAEYNAHTGRAIRITTRIQKAMDEKGIEGREGLAEYYLSGGSFAPKNVDDADDEEGGEDVPEIDLNEVPE